MASLSELAVPIDGSEYLDLDALLHALHDWAVKQKFCFRVAKRDKTRALFLCAEAEDLGCTWRCRAAPNFGDDDDDDDPPESWTLFIEESIHSCMGRGQRTHSSATKHEWLDAVVSRHINVTKKTTPQNIVDLLRVRFAEEVSYKVAQLCRLRLLHEDIGAQRHSFTLLPAYRHHLETKSPSVFVDLVKDLHSKSFSLFLSPFLMSCTNYL